MGEILVRKQHKTRPSASRLTDTLRNFNYSFEGAVSDLVDNSVAADASEIWIDFSLDRAGTVEFCITDNGHGMDEDELINALTYGSEVRDNLASLGKFGLGLKTASTAFCRHLEVVSKTKNGSTVGGTLDLDEVDRADEWIVETGTPDRALLERLNSKAPERAGTTISWNKIDRLRLNDFVDKNSTKHLKALQKEQKALKDHLAMVFQRYLDHADNRCPNIQIFLNDVVIQPWDPFCKSFSQRLDVEEKHTVRTTAEKTGTFSIAAYVLPRKDEWASPEAFGNARISTDSQGIYVYRENRLIYGPNWLGMAKSEVHTSLARIELSFDNHLDDSFGVGVDKANVRITNAGIYDFVEKDVVRPLRKMAESHHRNLDGMSSSRPTAMHDLSEKGITNKISTLDVATVENGNSNAGSATLLTKAGQKIFRIVPTTEVGEAGHISVSREGQGSPLWKPAIVDNKLAVIINSDHKFYEQVYLENEGNTSLIQALDYLIWSLAQAEIFNANPESRLIFEDFKQDVSRNLTKLIANFELH